MAYSGADAFTETESVMDEVQTRSHSHFTCLLALIILALASPRGQAADYGVGVSLLEDGAAVYLPINLASHWRVEPVLSFEREEKTQQDADTFYREMALGIGGFYRYSLAHDQADVYVGARLLVLRRDETEHKTNALSRPHRLDSEYRGFQSNALVGIDFYFSRAFAIGGEVGLEYTEYDVDFHDDMMGSDQASVSNTRTRSNLIARYYF